MPKARSKSNEPARRLRRRTKRRLTWAAAAVAAIVVILVFYLWASIPPGPFVTSLGHEHLQAEDQKHVPYNSVPPTVRPGTCPYIARWGVHSEPISNELQVHNLEYGGVLVQYNCPQGCPDLLARLRAIVLRYDTRHPGALPGHGRRIALTAWSRIDKFDEVDEKRIVRFIEAYRGIDHHPRGSLF